MTKHEFIEKLDSLSADQLARILPHLEADLAAMDQLAELKEQVEIGRRSAESDPLEDGADLYRRVRKSLH